MANLERYVQSVLGPIDHSRDLTRHTGRVVAVTDREGRQWVVKTVPTRAAFECELEAYTLWVPRFADQAPALVHAHRRLRTLVLEHVPGHSGWSFEPDEHREAGRLLQRLHTAAPSRSDGPGIGERTAQKLEVARSHLPDPGLLSADELAFARSSVAVLRARFHNLPRVPCHGDYGGHNWIRGGSRMQVIDFSCARWNVASSDFARLFIGPWWGRPDLVDAFFDGYGRPLTAEEVECIRHQLPALAISVLVHGLRNGHPRMARRGRDRLRKLMDGRDFTREPLLRRRYEAARGVARSVRTARH